MLMSANRSFSCTISVSILRSDSSSRSRWVSMRSPSRSCSPIFSSSSSITPRSIATLYLDSTSSSDDVWLRAWRSKSSLCTSMSRSLSWSVRWASRRLVISFCSVFCALLASVLLCLYFVYGCASVAMSQSCRSQGISSRIPSILPLRTLDARPFPAASALSSRSPPHRARVRPLALYSRLGTPEVRLPSSRTATCSRLAPLPCCSSLHSAAKRGHRLLP